MSTQELKVYRRSELEAVESGCLHRYRKIWIDKVDDSSDPALIGFTRGNMTRWPQLSVAMGLCSANTDPACRPCRTIFRCGTV